MEKEEDYKKILLGIRARKRLFIPDTKTEIELRMLSTNEVIDAQEEKKAFLEARKISDNQLCDALEENVQVTYRAALKPGTSKRYFKCPEDIRDLTQEHLLYIADQYRILANDHNPSLDEMSKDELNDLKKKLLDGENVNDLNYFQLQSLCNHLVESLAISTQHVKSSSGADQKSSSTSNGSSTPPSTNQSQEKSLKKDPPKEEAVDPSTEEKEIPSVPQT